MNAAFVEQGLELSEDVLLHFKLILHHLLPGFGHLSPALHLLIPCLQDGTSLHAAQQS